MRRNPPRCLTTLVRAPPLSAFVPPLHIWLRFRRAAAVVCASAVFVAVPPRIYATTVEETPAVLYDARFARESRGLWDAAGLRNGSSSSGAVLTPVRVPRERLRGSPKRVLLEDELRILMRLVVAATVGGIIGVERRSARSYAGVRTFSLVSLGAAIFMSVCLVAFPNADPARIAAAISSSVGFIGGGVMSKNSKHSRGLTTATSVWLAAGLGIAAASGLFVLSYAGAVLTVLIARYARFDNSLQLIRGDPLEWRDPLSDDPHPADDTAHLVDSAGDNDAVPAYRYREELDAFRKNGSLDAPHGNSERRD